MAYMDCPRCTAELITESLDGRLKPGGNLGPFRSNPNLAEAVEKMGRMIWVDRCSKCAGIWFDRGELSRAMRSLEIMDVPDPPSDLRFGYDVRGPCPRCQGRMDAFSSQVVPGVVFNACSNCGGIWLDAGEVVRFANPLVALSSFISAEFG